MPETHRPVEANLQFWKDVLPPGGANTQPPLTGLPLGARRGATQETQGGRRQRPILKELRVGGGGERVDSGPDLRCRGIDPVTQVRAPQAKSYHLSRFLRARPAPALSARRAA